MKPRKLSDVESYTSLIDKFSSKATVSNNYMLPTEVTKLISNGNLYYCHGQENCFVIVKKDAGVSRLYYLLNNLEEPLSIETGDSLVTEILFRGSCGEPSEEKHYLESNGFTPNIRRDQYCGAIPNCPEREPVFVQSVTDASSVAALFNSTFDKYSGDYISPDKAETIYADKAFLCAYGRSGEIKGALHINIAGRNAWVAHLAVDRQFRGKGVADILMEMFVTTAISHDCKRLMLWVGHDNKAAISLYEKYGLKYANKSTISYIKK